MEKLIQRLKQDFPSLGFEPGMTFSWSPRYNRITYKTAIDHKDMGQWSLLHELGHALLEHQTYLTDFELLNMEVLAWERAREIGRKYGIEIAPEHIQDCLDTYRDWLYQRSTCPTCHACSMQRAKPLRYVCYNCGTTWLVSKSRHCRPYRRRTDKAGLTI